VGSQIAFDCGSKPLHRAGEGLLEQIGIDCAPPCGCVVASEDAHCDGADLAPAAGLRADTESLADDWVSLREFMLLMRASFATLGWK
jgi:hypothetical protein